MVAFKEMFIVEPGGPGILITSAVLGACRIPLHGNVRSSVPFNVDTALPFSSLRSVRHLVNMVRYNATAGTNIEMVQVNRPYGAGLYFSNPWCRE